MEDEFEVWHEVFRGNEFLTVFEAYGAPIDVPESPFPGGYTSREDLLREGKS